ncbi:MAG: tetratricopeptide repeat protein, partial [Anaerolineales bacterium]|nr:tetratricopeptide repeat protein [Anaerolineales bacterium]
MAKVSLRIYNREIESLIDQGNTNEAIAHCHHILRTFSKHLATYRLLGKAYLELKRYNEAVDIFGRVLMSAPDDFVSHVGMSIINDEENKLDDSIWHMERAFEAQPSNAAIQGELQRLYGRRDGMEPPKIRMTRGALAHMYVQGELYPQAIAEIRAVLAEDSQRADMQVLLALAYFRGGQKADASDMCAQLLKRYTYCFDANRIMVDLLPSTAGVAESTQVYRMRVGELDPYATFTKSSVFRIDEVADAAINLERLEYKEEEPQIGQEWSSSLGLGSGAASAPALAAASASDQPDWLKAGGFSDSQSNLFAATQTPTPNSQGASEPSNEIPDFLRDAGWGESNTPEKATSFFDEEPVSGGLTPAELPDWLRGQIPSDTAQTATPQPEPAQSIETPDWLLDNSQTSESNSAQAGNIPDWLSGLDTPQVSASEPAQAVNIPDWLSGLDTPQDSAPEPAQAGNIPDWLSGLDTPQNSAPEPALSSNTPDWMSELDAPQDSTFEPAQPGNIPDWLSGLDTPQDSALESAPADNAPNWLNDMDSKNQEPSQSTPSVESLGSTAQEQDDAVAWLESLAAKHGAKPEELVTDPSKRFEKPPEWVSQAQNLNQQTPAASVESLGSTAQEQDDAVAWLESLAAKHGAKPEEMVTDPSKRFETPPEWVSQAQSIGEAQSASAMEVEKSDQQSERVENALNIGEQYFADFENASTAAPATDETSAWLRSLDEEEKQAESGKFEEQDLHRAEIPEWLSDTQQPQNSDGQFEFAKQESDAQKSDLPNWLSDIEKDVTPQKTFTDQDMPANDLSDWLSGLDDEPGLPFDAVPTPDSILFSSKSTEPATKSDLPDWLRGVDSQDVEPVDEWKSSVEEEPAIAASKQTEMPVPVSQTENLPSWLQNVDEEEKPIVEDDDDTPPWLHREKWEAEEPQAPMPTSPSDWHPIAQKQPETIPASKQEIPVEIHKPFTPQDVPPPQPISSQPAAPAQPEAPAKKKKQLGLPARKPQPETLNVVVALNQAKGELDRGDIPAALSHYGKLIKKGKHLEETIR